MAKLTKTEARNILRALDKHKSKKWVTLEVLSSWVGVYPDILGEQLSEYDPTALLDPDFDVRAVEEVLRAYVEEVTNRREEPRVVVTKKKLSEYESVSDFIYKKMTNAGGLFDKDAYLSDVDLATLKKLVNEEIRSRKAVKKKKR